MSRWHYILFASAMTAGLASPQSFPADLQKYLSLTDPQVQSITDLNSQFSLFASQQQSQSYALQAKASSELVKPSPDPAVVGDAYSQLEMLRRAYTDQLAQVQSKIAATLTPDQVLLVNSLLNVERLQPLISEAQCIHLETQTVAFADFLLGVPALYTCLLYTSDAADE